VWGLMTHLESIHSHSCSRSAQPRTRTTMPLHGMTLWPATSSAAGETSMDSYDTRVLYDAVGASRSIGTRLRE